MKQNGFLFYVSHTYLQDKGKMSCIINIPTFQKGQSALGFANGNIEIK